MSDLDPAGWNPIVVGTPGVAFEPVAPTSAPYRPDTVVDGWSTDRLTVRCASVRGSLHRYRGVAREDDVAVTLHPATGSVVIAVADGVSGAAQAHLGATLACRAATDFLLRALDAAADHGSPDHKSGSGGSAGGAGIDWAELLRCASWSLVEYAARQGWTAGPDPVGAERLLATTLVAGVVQPSADGPTTARLVQIGDTGAWLLSGDRWRTVLGGKLDPDGPMLADGVAALPRIPGQPVTADLELTPGDLLLIGTDGVGDPFGTGEGPVGELFRAHLVPAPSPLELGRLLDFSRETFDDDRTLAGIWVRSATARDR